VEHWRAAAVEACKQSGNPFLPHIAAPAPLKTWLAGEFPKTLAFIGSLEPDAPPLALTARTTGNAGVADANANDAAAVAAPERLLVLIGPEGDFSPAEYALIRARGFRAVRFGPNVLRVPTAAHYALAALDQLRQRLFANANSSTA
jgi:16S rRNA (uracil1498-N3)-methyltransferase